MTKKLDFLNLLLVFSCLCILFYQLLFHFSTMSLAKILTTTSILPIIMLPYVIDRICSYRLSPVLLCCYDLFVLLSLGLGSVLGFYQKISWFDLFMHFLSGGVSVIFSWIILERCGLFNSERKGFLFLFSVLVAMSIACGWEFFEFFSDKIFGGDVQYVVETGVTDTMEDLLMGTLGSLFVSIVTYWKMKKDRSYIKKIKEVVRGEAK